jgi:hypothetical protein
MCRKACRFESCPEHHPLLLLELRMAQPLKWKQEQRMVPSAALAKEGGSGFARREYRVNVISR